MAKKRKRRPTHKFRRIPKPSSGYHGQEGPVVSKRDIVRVREQLAEFGVQEEVAESIMERVSRDEKLAPVALLNLFLMHRELEYEDVGGYISGRPHTVTMGTALLGRSLGLHPHGIPRHIPYSLRGQIIKKRKIKPEPVVDEEIRKARQRAGELKKSRQERGVSVYDSLRVSEALAGNGYDPETAARNICYALRTMPKEEVLTLIRADRRIRSVSQEELDEVLQDFHLRKIAKELRQEFGMLVTGWSKFVEAAKECGENGGIDELRTKLALLKEFAAENSISPEKFQRFVNGNFAIIAAEKDIDRLTEMLREGAENGKKACRYSEALKKLEHARRHRLKGMDGKALYELLSETGFKVVSASGGGGHYRAEHEGEIVKNKKGGSVVIIRKTSGNLAHGTVIDILDSLIEHLKNRISSHPLH